jgi:hypothetical protein
MLKIINKKHKGPKKKKKPLGGAGYINCFRCSMRPTPELSDNKKKTHF